MRRSALVALTGLALLVAMAVPALAQYPPAAPSAAVSDFTIVPGQPVTVAGDGWLPNSQVTFTFFSDPVVLGTAQVDATGSFSSQVTIPADARPGPHTLRTSGLAANGQPASVDLRIVVTGLERPTPSRAGVTPAPGLPRTGGDALVALMTAAGLLAVGSTAVVVARRRSRGEFGG